MDNDGASLTQRHPEPLGQGASERLGRVRILTHVYLYPYLYICKMGHALRMSVMLLSYETLIHLKWEEKLVTAQKVNLYLLPHLEIIKVLLDF